MRSRCLLGLLAVLLVGLLGAGNDTLLDRYLGGLHTLRTQFTQSVTDAHGKLVASGSGSLLVQRPGRFRWEYQPGTSAGGTGAADQGGQVLIADGRNLWFYDQELAQVTVKPISAGLSATPIMLLSGAQPDLRESFTIMSEPRQDGLDWVMVRPSSQDADFSDARIGFRGNELVRMVFHDKLGETVELDFSHPERNAPVNLQAFHFTVPPGVDVIGTPQH